ncbi:tetratricopeptide repeat protein [Planctomycetota bacterium]
MTISSCINEILATSAARLLLVLHAGEEVAESSVAHIGDLTMADPISIPRAVAVRVWELRNDSVAQDDEFVERMEVRLLRADGSICVGGYEYIHAFDSVHGEHDVLWSDIELTQTVTRQVERQIDPKLLSRCTEYEKYRIGEKLCCLGEYEEAEPILAQATNGKTSSYSCAATLCQITALNHLGRLEEAFDVCQRAKERFPESTSLFFMEGVTRHLMGDVNRAIGCYQVSIDESEPSSGYGSFDAGISKYKAPHNLALAAFEQGDHSRAEAVWKRLAAKTSGFQQAYFGLIDMFLSVERYSDVQLFCHANRTRFGSGDVELIYAKMAEKIGDDNRKVRHLEAGMRTAPLNEMLLFEYCKHAKATNASEEYEPAMAELTNLWSGSIVRRCHAGSVLSDLRDRLVKSERHEFATQVDQHLERLEEENNRLEFLAYLIDR